MKKILNIVVPLIIVTMIWLIPEQGNYYLKDDILQLSLLQMTLISLAIITIFLIFFLRFNKDDKKLDIVWGVTKTASYFILLGWVLYTFALKDGILWMNRIHSSQQKNFTFEVRVLGDIQIPFIDDDNGESIIFRLDDKFESLKNQTILDRDSVSIQLEKGLFGLYYINHEKTQVIPSKIQQPEAKN